MALGAMLHIDGVLEAPLDILLLAGAAQKKLAAFSLNSSLH